MSDEALPETRAALSPVRAALRSWYTSPPRSHGEVIEDRQVSFLELFYDLVFVLLIARIAHTLAGDVTMAGFRNFAIVFSLVWIAWINGSMYHELHGRADGRSRTSIFVQMALLVLLSVYIAHAADNASDGRGFAIVYAVLLGFVGLQWFQIRRHATPEMANFTTRYLAGIAIAVALVAVSAAIDDSTTRLVLWTAAAAVILLVALTQLATRDTASATTVSVTDSMAERFGLFTIIVLGEVVVGVADGLAEAEHTPRSIVTGLLALGIGFAFWWTYFDFVGGRPPRPGSRPRTLWLYGHYPLTLAIAATGAGIVSLIEQAPNARTTAATAWLIAGSTAAIAITLAAITTTMQPHPGRRVVPYTLTATAALALAVGAFRPAPWVLAFGLYAALFAVWIESFIRHAKTGSPISEL